MKKILIAVGCSVGVLASIATFNYARSYFAASAIYADYKECAIAYPLPGKKDQFLAGETEDEKRTERYTRTLEQIEKAEASCAKYNKYLDEWGDRHIKPSTDLVLALVSRYEPERLK